MIARRYNEVSKMTTTPRSAASCHRRLGELFAEAGVSVVGGVSSPDVSITSLTDDSRAVERGSCFVAVRGVACDGHGFVASAARAGAAAIVVDQDVTSPKGLCGEWLGSRSDRLESRFHRALGTGSVGPVCVRVADTRVALAKLAAAW